MRGLLVLQRRRCFGHRSGNHGRVDGVLESQGRIENLRFELLVVTLVGFGVCLGLFVGGLLVGDLLRLDLRENRRHGCFEFALDLGVLDVLVGGVGLEVRMVRQLDLAETVRHGLPLVERVVRPVCVHAFVILTRNTDESCFHGERRARLPPPVPA